MLHIDKLHKQPAGLVWISLAWIPGYFLPDKSSWIVFPEGFILKVVLSFGLLKTPLLAVTV